MRRAGRGSHAIDMLVARIAGKAEDDSEQLGAFRQAFDDGISLPVDGLVMGEPVAVRGFEYDGNPRRGLTARCHRGEGGEYSVAAWELAFPPETEGARLVEAYRRWIELAGQRAAAPGRAKSRRAAAAPAIELNRTVELAALSVKKLAVRCRMLTGGEPITLRAAQDRSVVPGRILQVTPRRQWTYAGNPYLSGEIESTGMDAGRLGLVPLRLEERGMWHPANHYWGEEGEPIEKWARPIIARGPRPAYEMEQVLPGYDYEDPELDPIGQAVDCKEAGDFEGAYKLLMGLCEADLRCLDAHAHLGNLKFDLNPQEAMRHYEAGLRIGELSLPEGFDGVLKWGHIDNRPFLRCLQGYGLCLWRLREFREAERVFERMLWLNPSDNQGVRFLIDDVRKKRRWTGE